jgi:hypothetical protein
VTLVECSLELALVNFRRQICAKLYGPLPRLTTYPPALHLGIDHPTRQLYTLILTVPPPGDYTTLTTAIRTQVDIAIQTSMASTKAARLGEE